MAAYLAAGQEEAAFEVRVEQLSARFAREGASEEVLGQVGTLLAQAERRESRLYLHLVQASLCLSRYDLAGVRQAAAAALALAEPATDAALSAQLLDAAALALGGEAAAACAAVQPLRPRLLACADPLLATDLWGYLAVVHAYAGPLDQCTEALLKQRQLAREVGKADDEAAALSSLCGQYSQRGELDLALATGMEAQALQRRMGATYALAGSQVNTAMAQLGLYRLGEALQTLQQARQSLEQLAPNPELDFIVADAEAEAWLRAGAPARAWALCEQEAAAPVSMPRRVARQVLRAQLLRDMGQPAEALALWREVLQARGSGQILLRAHLLAVLALAGEADEQLPALAAAASEQPPAVQGLARWALSDAALRRGEAAGALAGARELRATLPRLRHVYMPQQALRQWLAETLAALAPADEAAQCRADNLAWWRSQVLPGLPAHTEPPQAPATLFGQACREDAPPGGASAQAGAQLPMQ